MADKTGNNAASGGAGQDKKPEQKTGADGEQKTYSNLAGAALEGEWQPGEKSLAGAGGGGQPGGGQSTAQKQAEQVAALEGLLVTGFQLMAARRGAHWQLKPAHTEEVNGEKVKLPGEGYLLAAAIDDCIRQYMPDDFDMGPGVTLALISVSVVGPRVATDWAARKQEKPSEKGGDNGSKS